MSLSQNVLSTFQPMSLVSCIHVEVFSAVLFYLITMKLKGKTRKWIIPHESQTDIIAATNVSHSIDVDSVVEGHLNINEWPILS